MPWTKTLDSELSFSERCQFGYPEKNLVCHREPRPLGDLGELLLNLGHKLRVAHPGKGDGSTFCVLWAV